MQQKEVKAVDNGEEILMVREDESRFLSGVD